MIQKITHMILAFLLFLATTGITVSEHFCGNYLVSVTITGSNHDCCGNPCKCCHNKVTHVQVSDHFVYSAHSVELNIPVLLAFAVIPSDIFLSRQRLIKEYSRTSDAAPPSYDSTTSFLQVFRC